MEPSGRTWDLGIGTLWIGDDQIAYHVVDEGASVTEEDALRVYDVAAEALGPRPRPHVVDLREVAYVERAARDRFAAGDPRCPELATALLVTGGVSILLGNLTLRLSRLEHPVRLFNDEAAAVEWAASHWPVVREAG